jgi:hypothetical protein
MTAGVATLPIVPEFLTTAWLEDLAAAARGAEPLPSELADLTVTLRQVVRGGPAGDVSYTVCIERGRLDVHPDAAERPGPPDLTLVTDYATAAAINKGELDAQQALASARLRISGNLDVLMRGGRSLAALDDVFAEVRSRTTYDQSSTVRGAGRGDSGRRAR